MHKYGAAISGHTNGIQVLIYASQNQDAFYVTTHFLYNRFDFHPIQWNNNGPWPPAILHSCTCAPLLHYPLPVTIHRSWKYQATQTVYTVIVGTQNHPLPGFFQRIKYLFLSALDFFQGPCVDFCPGCCDGPCPDCRTSAWTLQNVWCKT